MALVQNNAMSQPDEERAVTKPLHAPLSHYTTFGFLWYPIILAGASALLTLGLGFVGRVSIENVFPATFREIWARWDTIHYLAIAGHGYPKQGDAVFLVCFFPLYPILIRVVAFAFQLQDLFVAAVVVSNLAFGVGLVFLQELVNLDFESPVSNAALLFCVAFPVGYFFHVAYTESLFFAVSLGTFYFARKGQWWAAGVLGFLSGITRLPGLVLTPALIMEYLYQRQFRLRDLRWSGLFTLMPALGFGVYLAMNYVLFGDPFRFLEIQAQLFVRKVDFPWVGFMDDWRALFTADASTRFLVRGEQVLFFFLTSGTLLWSAFKLRPAYTVYGALLWLLTFCYGFWLSIPRMVMVIFPLYIFLGWLTYKRPALRQSLLFGSTLLYAIGLIQFARGWWAH